MTAGSSVTKTKKHKQYEKDLHFNDCSIIRRYCKGQDWVWQNPLPQGNNLKCVKFIDANTGYAVSDVSILKTTDGGNTWIIQKTVNTPLNSTLIVLIQDML